MSGAVALLAGAVLLWPGPRRPGRLVSRGGARRRRPRAGGRAVAGCRRLLAGSVAALAARPEHRARRGARRALRLAGGAGLAHGTAGRRARRGACRPDRGARCARCRAAQRPVGGRRRPGPPSRPAPTSGAAGAGPRRPRARGRAGRAAIRSVGGGLARISAAVLLSGRTGCSLAAVAGAPSRTICVPGDRQRAGAPRRRPRAPGQRGAAGRAAGARAGDGQRRRRRPVARADRDRAGQLLLVVGVGLEVAGLAWTGRLVARALR